MRIVRAKLREAPAHEIEDLGHQIDASVLPVVRAAAVDRRQDRGLHVEGSVSLCRSISSLGSPARRRLFSETSDSRTLPGQKSLAEQTRVRGVNARGWKTTREGSRLRNRRPQTRRKATQTPTPVSGRTRTRCSGVHSPHRAARVYRPRVARLHLRLPDHLRSAVDAEANRMGLTVSELAREALAVYVAWHRALDAVDDGEAVEDLRDAAAVLRHLLDQ